MDVWRSLLTQRMALLNSHLWLCAKYRLPSVLCPAQSDLMKRHLTGAVTIECLYGGFEMTKSVCKGGFEGATEVHVDEFHISDHLNHVFDIQSMYHGEAKQ
jgi:hypothetical protein